MKKTKRFLGVLIFGMVLILLFYGIKSVEKAERIDSEDHFEDQSRERNLHKNPDVYARIQIKGTKIDYPVAQHPTDDTYYLGHDLEHNKTYYGAIFSEKINRKNFEDNVTIIYGHAIMDGSMFGSLSDWSNESVFETYQDIEIETKDSTHTYRIVAAYTFTDEHLYHTFHLDDEKEVERYYTQLEQFAKENGGLYRKNSFDATKDRILILSTCDSTTEGRRFLVHAVKKGE